MRVPTSPVSVVGFVVELERDTTVEEVNETFRRAAGDELSGIVGDPDEPLVSIDFRGDPRSAVVDGLSTMVVGDTMAKVVAWYDNEWGYSCRVADLAYFMMVGSMQEE